MLARRSPNNCSRATPSLRILATSREPLLIAGERQHRVAPLAGPDPAALPGSDAVADFPAVQLFVARAQAIVPTFRLTPANAPLIARICARLDGIPLALELAAARAHVLTLEQMLDRLDDSIRLLVGGSRVAPTRQQTMRAAFDWSDALLTEVGARGFLPAGGLRGRHSRSRRWRRSVPLPIYHRLMSSRR